MKSVRVLLVDDSRMFAKAANRFLDSLAEVGVVAIAESGEEAIARLQACRPDVVLMDIVMPGMSGLTATRLIKQRSDAPKVVILTSHTAPEYRAAAFAAGADGFLSKDDLVTDFAMLVASLFDRTPDGPSVAADAGGGI